MHLARVVTFAGRQELAERRLRIGHETGAALCRHGGLLDRGNHERVRRHALLLGGDSGSLLQVIGKFQGCGDHLGYLRDISVTKVTPSTGGVQALALPVMASDVVAPVTGLGEVHSAPATDPAHPFHMTRHLLLLLCALASGVSVAAPPKPQEAPVEIVAAEFGLFDASDPRELVFEPASIVPHQEGQRYGWVIEVRTRKRSLAVREEYLLATPATEAGPVMNPSGRHLDIPLPRRNQVSQRQLVPVGGRIYGEWAIGPGEPTGKRHLQVIVEGQVAGSFEYEVK